VIVFNDPLLTGRSVRLPFSVALVLQNPKANATVIAANPSLQVISRSMFYIDATACQYRLNRIE
jgi:hypothetical protein